MKKKLQPTEAISVPQFDNESAEAAWWASREGRAFLRSQPPAVSVSGKSGSGLVRKLNNQASVQIALRLPAPDLAKAREIAETKGIGYQTLLKMFVHEGLEREFRRQA